MSPLNPYQRKEEPQEISWMVTGAINGFIREGVTDLFIFYYAGLGGPRRNYILTPHRDNAVVFLERHEAERIVRELEQKYRGTGARYMVWNIVRE